MKVANFDDLQGFDFRYNTFEGQLQLDVAEGSDVDLVGNVGVMPGFGCPDDVTYSYNVWTTQQCATRPTHRRRTRSTTSSIPRTTTGGRRAARRSSTPPLRPTTRRPIETG